MSIVHRYVVAIASLACTAILMFGIGCSSCLVKPVTTESKGPALMLSVVDQTNPSANPGLKNIKATKPFSLPGENNYQYLFVIVATDSGGLSSMEYTEVFNTGCPCNPNSGSCPGSFQSGGGPIQPNSDGTVPNEWFELVSVSAAAEKAAVGCPASAATVTGTYVVKVTATNPSGKKTVETWNLTIP
ncbi:MAG: hypothetical protein WCF68_04825 [Terriglobales bacterium]